jgi:hypothetical protein
MPASIAFEGADMGTGIGGTDYDQMGMARVYGDGGGGRQAGFGGFTSMIGGSGSAGGPIPVIGDGGSSVGGLGGSPPAPQITVNVQAMDARSFLDRSNDIAAAVREAMLNMSSINDVVSEL